jgi:hypothetical protein
MMGAKAANKKPAPEVAVERGCAHGVHELRIFVDEAKATTSDRGAVLLFGRCAAEGCDAGFILEKGWNTGTVVARRVE